MDENERYAYIKVHKDYCHEYVNKEEQNKKSYMMVLPKGTTVSDTDLSYGKIYPLYVSQDKFNPNMMIAKYDKEHLKDNAISVMNLDSDKKFLKVDIDTLARAVKEANQNYLQQQELKKTNEVKEELEY